MTDETFEQWLERKASESPTPVEPVDHVTIELNELRVKLVRILWIHFNVNPEVTYPQLFQQER